MALATETKTVLGRVFTWLEDDDEWACETTHGVLTLGETLLGQIGATLRDGYDEIVAEAEGPTEADAILALQATLRKMAELEVANG